MAKLTHLPNELLLEIVFYLRETDWTTRESSADLSCLARSCKRLYNITNPVLYSAPTAWKGQHLLLRTLAWRPDLSTLVRAIDGGCWEVIDDFPLTDQDRLKIEEAVAWWGVFPPPDWFTAMRHCVYQGKLCFYALDLILALVSVNIEAVLYPCSGWPDERTPLQLRMAYDGNPVFPRLRFLYHVPHPWNGDEECVRIDLQPEYQIIDHCSELESLWLNKLGYAKASYLPNEGRGYLPKLKSLRMIQCENGMEDLRYLFNTTKVLEEFSYSQSTEGQPDPMSLVLLSQYLQPFANTLKHLHLVAFWVEEGETLGSLRHYKNLETLILSHTSLVHTGTDATLEECQEMIELLPRSLKYLALTGGNFDMDRGEFHARPLASVLAYALGQGQFPNLKKVVLQPPKDQNAEWKASVDQIKAAGVAYFDYTPDNLGDQRFSPPRYEFAPGYHFLKPRANHWSESPQTDAASSETDGSSQADDDPMEIDDEPNESPEAAPKVFQPVDEYHEYLACDADIYGKPNWDSYPEYTEGTEWMKRLTEYQVDKFR